MPRLAAFVAIGAFVADNAMSVEQLLGEDEYGISAPARITYSLVATPKPKRLDFDFRAGDSFAWLNDDGNFQVSGWIQHAGLLCATYRTGIRFGVGSPGCLNVKWISEPRFVTNEVQCNDSRIEHTGGDTDPALGKQLAGITCGERVVRCTGYCK